MVTEVQDARRMQGGAPTNIERSGKASWRTLHLTKTWKNNYSSNVLRPVASNHIVYKSIDPQKYFSSLRVETMIQLSKRT